MPDPERFGVAEFAGDRLIRFEEKPPEPKSDMIPIGVYFLRPDAFDVIAGLSPSGRGELEITDVLNHYLRDDRLLWREYTGHWSDAGTMDSLLRAGRLASDADSRGELPKPFVRPAMKLLVCGGAGFIGSTFVHQRLATTTDEIVVLDKLTYAGNRANLATLDADPALAARAQFVRGDICDADLVRSLLAGVDAIVNFAAESHVDRSVLDSAAFLHTGVEGVRVLLEALRSADRPVRLVQVSTDEVYGPRLEGASTEGDPLRPRSPYAAAKASGDLLVGAYHATHGLDVVDHARLEHVWATPASGEARRIGHHQCPLRYACAALRRRLARARLAACRRSRRGRWLSSWTGANRAASTTFRRASR